MSNVISRCPVCGGKLQITALHCSGCGLELRNQFELSRFDALGPEESDFLIAFLKQRGNLRAVQEVLGTSYPTAKRRLEKLLTELDLIEEKESEMELDMEIWTRKKDSVKASEIVKQKLIEAGGKTVVYTVRDSPCEIKAAPDGVSFFCDKLPITPPYRYEVFDIIVELLISQDGRARKGNGRDHRLGEPGCDAQTVAGAIGYHYAHTEEGKYIFDPVFALAAVLEWAGLVHNERGELVLTASYRKACGLS